MAKSKFNQQSKSENKTGSDISEIYDKSAYKDWQDEFNAEYGFDNIRNLSGKIEPELEKSYIDKFNKNYPDYPAVSSYEEISIALQMIYESTLKKLQELETVAENATVEIEKEIHKCDENCFNQAKKDFILAECRQLIVDNAFKMITESADLNIMCLSGLVKRLPQLARAAEKQGKHGLAGEYYNLLNVAGQALNKLNDLSPDALNFNPD